MKKRILIWTVLSVLMVSCSPSVTSEMLTHDFTAQPTNRVAIYGAADSVPTEVRAIGQVTVDGKSASLKNQYARALNLAIAETARNGGNVLVVDNSEIKDNRLKGTIAYTDGEVNKSLTLSAERVAQLQATGFTRKNSVVAQMDSTKQQAIVRQQAADWEQERARMQKAYMRQDSIAHANGEATYDFEAEQKPLGGMVKVSIGPAWTTSKLYYQTWNGLEYLSSQRGYALSLSISNTGSKAYGFGCDFYGSYTKVDAATMGDLVDYSYTLMYLGPCFLIGGNITNWLRIDGSLGLGLAYCQDDGDTEFGGGTRLSLGLECMVSKSAGIGVDFVRQISIFPKPDGLKLPDDETYGFHQICIMATARFHF